MFSPSDKTKKSVGIQNRLNEQEKKYGEKFHDHLLQQYQMYASTIQHTTDKRIQVITWYIAILSLITILSLQLAQNGNVKPLQNIIFPILSIVGFTLSVLWFLSIHSCNRLIHAKLLLIKEIEQFLPLEIYSLQYDILNEVRYLHLSRLDILVPLIIGLTYIIFGFWIIVK